MCNLFSSDSLGSNAPSLGDSADRKYPILYHLLFFVNIMRKSNLLNTWFKENAIFIHFVYSPCLYFLNSTYVYFFSHF